MMMTDLEELNAQIDISWDKLRQSYSDMTSDSINKSESNISSEPDRDDEVIDISKDIPSLQSLIASQSNRSILEKELKEIIMKFYWNGFYKGFEIVDKSDLKPTSK